MAEERKGKITKETSDFRGHRSFEKGQSGGDAGTRKPANLNEAANKKEDKEKR